jgi:hypothetical protein
VIAASTGDLRAVETECPARPAFKPRQVFTLAFLVYDAVEARASGPWGPVAARADRLVAFQVLARLLGEGLIWPRTLVGGNVVDADAAAKRRYVTA